MCQVKVADRMEGHQPDVPGGEGLEGDEKGCSGGPAQGSDASRSPQKRAEGGQGRAGVKWARWSSRVPEPRPSPLVLYSVSDQTLSRTAKPLDSKDLLLCPPRPSVWYGECLRTSLGVQLQLSQVWEEGCV